MWWWWGLPRGCARRRGSCTLHDPGSRRGRWGGRRRRGVHRARGHPDRAGAPGSAGDARGVLADPAVPARRPGVRHRRDPAARRQRGLRRASAREIGVAAAAVHAGAGVHRRGAGTACAPVRPAGAGRSRPELHARASSPGCCWAGSPLRRSARWRHLRLVIGRRRQGPADLGRRATARHRPVLPCSWSRTSPWRSTCRWWRSLAGAAAGDAPVLVWRSRSRRSRGAVRRGALRPAASAGWSPASPTRRCC